MTTDSLEQRLKAFNDNPSIVSEPFDILPQYPEREQSERAAKRSNSPRPIPVWLKSIADTCRINRDEDQWYLRLCVDYDLACKKLKESVIAEKAASIEAAKELPDYKSPKLEESDINNLKKHLSEAPRELSAEQKEMRIRLLRMMPFFGILFNEDDAAILTATVLVSTGFPVNKGFGDGFCWRHMSPHGMSFAESMYAHVFFLSALEGRGRVVGNLDIIDFVMRYDQCEKGFSTPIIAMSNHKAEMLVRAGFELIIACGKLSEDALRRLTVAGTPTWGADIHMPKADAFTVQTGDSDKSIVLCLKHPVNLSHSWYGGAYLARMYARVYDIYDRAYRGSVQ
jgi:hypothetical protein